MKTLKQITLLTIFLLTSPFIFANNVFASCPGNQSTSWKCITEDGSTAPKNLCINNIGPEPASRSRSCTATSGCPTPPSFSGGGGGGGGGFSGSVDTDSDGTTDSAAPGNHSSPNSSTSPVGSVSNGAGGGGAKVLCGHFFTRGILLPNIYAGDVAFANKFASNSSKRGYHLWAVPLTKHLNNNPNGFVEKMTKPFVIGWATEMAHRTGHTDNGHWIGKLQLSIVEPFVSFIGRFVDDTEWKNLTSEQEIEEKKLTEISG